MTDEINEVVVTPTDESVTEPVDTASTENPDIETPEPERVFTQTELNEILAKRVAKESRRNERELRGKIEQLEQRFYEQATPRQEAPSSLHRSHFASDEDYLDAKIEERLARPLAEQRAAEEAKIALTVQQKKESILSAAEATGEFDRDDFFGEVKITPIMADAILDSDLGTKLVLHLNSNPSEAARIAGLPQARQAAEIGKLEVTLSNAKVTKSGAPTPITPLGSSGKVSKDPSQMSDSEFAKMRKAQIAQRGN